MPSRLSYDWPLPLLALCIPLCGAKTETDFLLWSLGGLFFCLWMVLRDARTIRLELPASLYVVLAASCLSFFFSGDHSQSLYLTFQVFFFILLWLFLQNSIQGWKTERPFWILLYTLAAVTCLWTLMELYRNRSPSAFLPINPNFNAAWMASLAAAFLGRTCTASGLSRREHLCNQILFLMLLICVALGHSRSALLALLAAGMYAASFRYSKMTLLLTALLACALIIGIFPSRVAGLFESFRHGIHWYRPQIWQAALQGILDHPLAGYGPANFEMAYQRHAFPVTEDAVRFARTTEFAHNEFLQLAVEFGLPLAGIVVLSLISLFRGKARTDVPARVGLLALVIASFFNPVWHVPALLYLTLLWAALLTKNRPARQQKKGPTAPFVLFFLFLGNSLLLGWFGLRAAWASQQRWDLVLRWNPWDAAAWESWAWQQKDDSKRLQGLAEAVRQSPQQLYYRESFAEALESTGRVLDIPLAWREYETALRLGPQRATDALAIGRLAFREHDARLALSWFKKAHALEPYYWESELWIARCLYALGEKRDARELLKNLPRRRNQFLLQRDTFLEGGSAYEQRILGYDQRVVDHELR